MFDLLIKNGTLFDGSGSGGFLGDIAIKDGKIAAIGKLSGEATQVIDATGLSVTPGFIDSHSHADGAILTFPQQKEKVEQGITTSIGGQCGISPAPVKKDGQLQKMSDFLHRASSVPQGANIALFAGHATIRSAVMGMENRAPTARELDEMKDLLRDAMDAGALGISFGLIYTPSCYAQTDELIALAQVATEKGGMIAAHIRNEGDGLIEAVEEFITVVKAANVRGVLSHHKAAWRANWGKVQKSVSLMEQAISEGCDIYCDVYPYTASKTSLSARFLPKEYCNGKVPEHLRDPALRAQFKARGNALWGDDLSWVLLCDCPPYPAYSGLTLPEAAKLHGKDVWETLFDILEKKPNTQGCYFMMCEEDVKTVLSWHRSMVCTDSSVAGNNSFYHPRLRGSFPRALGEYVRREKVVTLSEMIRKMTSLPARVYGLTGKGLLKVGYDADICIFDPTTILDNATYTDPARGATGLSFVLVGGQIVAQNARSTGKTPGHLLLR